MSEKMTQDLNKGAQTTAQAASAAGKGAKTGAKVVKKSVHAGAKVATELTTTAGRIKWGIIVAAAVILLIFILMTGGVPGTSFNSFTGINPAQDPIEGLDENGNEDDFVDLSDAQKTEVEGIEILGKELASEKADAEKKVVEQAKEAGVDPEATLQMMNANFVTIGGETVKGHQENGEYTEEEFQAGVLLSAYSISVNNLWGFNEDFVPGMSSGLDPDSIDTSTREGRAQYIYARLLQDGCTPECACGILGNLEHENGSFDPSVGEKGGTKAGRGIAQWTKGGGRWKTLMKFAKKNGTKWNDFKTQVDALIYELNGAEATWKTCLKKCHAAPYADLRCDTHGYSTHSGYTPEKFKHVKDIGLATCIFRDHFERPGQVHSSKVSVRLASAKKWYTKFKDLGKAVAASGDANEQVRQAAVNWGIQIGNDDTFHYGKKPAAQHLGCYFCGTNQPSNCAKAKAGLSFKQREKTWACCEFVTACYVHGGKVKGMGCMKNFIGTGANKNTYLKTSKYWKKVNPSYSELQVGDVIIFPGHATIYAGNGKVIQSHGGDDGKYMSKKWKKSIGLWSFSKKQFKKKHTVYRYIGGVEGSTLWASGSAGTKTASSGTAYTSSSAGTGTYLNPDNFYGEAKYAGCGKSGIYISKYKNRGWSKLLRPKNPALALAIANAAIQANKYKNVPPVKFNSGLSKRQTYYKELENVGFDYSKVHKKCYSTCSSFASVCARGGGVPKKYAPALVYSTTLPNKLMQSGLYEEHKGKKYANNPDYWRPGDLLVLDGAHCYTVVQSKNKLSVAAGSGGTTKTAQKDPTADLKTFKSYKKIASIESSDVTSYMTGKEIDGYTYSQAMDWIGGGQFVLSMCNGGAKNKSMIVKYSSKKEVGHQQSDSARHGNGLCYNSKTGTIYVARASVGGGDRHVLTMFNAESLKETGTQKLKKVTTSSIGYDGYTDRYVLQQKDKIVILDSGFNIIKKVSKKKHALPQDSNGFNGVAFCVMQGAADIELHRMKDGAYLGTIATGLGEIESVCIDDEGYMLLINAHRKIYKTKKKISSYIPLPDTRLEGGEETGDEDDKSALYSEGNWRIDMQDRFRTFLQSENYYSVIVEKNKKGKPVKYDGVISTDTDAVSEIDDYTKEAEKKKQEAVNASTGVDLQNPIQDLMGSTDPDKLAEEMHKINEATGASNHGTSKEEDAKAAEERKAAKEAREKLKQKKYINVTLKQKDIYAFASAAFGVTQADIRDLYGPAASRDVTLRDMSFDQIALLHDADDIEKARVYENYDPAYKIGDSLGTFKFTTYTNSTQEGRIHMRKILTRKSLMKSSPKRKAMITCAAPKSIPVGTVIYVKKLKCVLVVEDTLKDDSNTIAIYIGKKEKNAEENKKQLSEAFGKKWKSKVHLALGITANEARSIGGYASGVGAKGAVAWGKKICDDQNFVYENGWGKCHFCNGTRKAYVCTTFVKACYAHGAKDPEMQKWCKNNDYGFVDPLHDAMKKSSHWKSVGRISISKMQPGDVIFFGDGHVEMYYGDGKFMGAHHKCANRADDISYKGGWNTYTAVMRYVYAGAPGSDGADDVEGVEDDEEEPETVGGGKGSYRVCIETGHGIDSKGNWDTGATWNGYQEAKLMIPIAKAMTKYLRDHGVYVYTDAYSGNDRNLDATLDYLDNHKFDAFVNLHCDYKDSPSGTLPLYRTAKQKKLAKYLNEGVHSAVKIKDRGLQKRTDLDTLTSSKVHCVACLFETGSIKADNKILRTQAKAYGEGLAKGLLKYLNSQ